MAPAYDHRRLQLQMEALGIRLEAMAYDLVEPDEDPATHWAMQLADEATSLENSLIIHFEKRRADGSLYKREQAKWDQLVRMRDAMQGAVESVHDPEAVEEWLDDVGAGDVPVTTSPDEYESW